MCYLAMNVAYSLRLKHTVLIDVGIIAAFLGQQGRKDALSQVWIGTATAVAICVGVAIALQVISSDLPQRQQEGLETVVGALATGMVPLATGYDRAEMIQPAVMAPPLNWLVSDAAGGVTGRRFLAVHWDPSLPPEEAAAKAGAPVAWTEIATMPIEPPRRR